MDRKYLIYSYRVIYAYTIPDAKHSGLIKVADRLVSLTPEEVKEAMKNPTVLDIFVKDQLPAGATLQKVWFGTIKHPATSERCAIKLQDIYNVLEERHEYVAMLENGWDRWFKATLTDVEDAVATARKIECGEAKLQKPLGIIFRPEQQKAIDDTVRAFRDEQRTRFLWNAKMRFGKTLSALQVAKEMGYKFTLIITHRPVVDDGWKEDFRKIFTNEGHDEYRRRNEKDKDSKEFVNLVKKVEADPEGRLVFFASMQYLRGSHLVGAKQSKSYKENAEKTAILNFPWDFIVVDEAHEGTQSDRGVEVMRYMKLNVPEGEAEDRAISAIDAITGKESEKSEESERSEESESSKKGEGKSISPREGRPVTLALSGTPFNLYSDYSPKEIYSWDYVKEQESKANWHDGHGDDPNPYDVLPRVNIFNLDIEDTIGRRVLRPGESESDENSTKQLTDEQLEDEYSGFSFSNFFRVWDKNLLVKQDKPEELLGKFIHETEIMDFFYALIRETQEGSNFPFSTKEFQKAFRHTFWLIPGVKEGKALQELLERDRWTVKGEDKPNPYKKGFRVINEAGSEQEDFTDKALRNVLNHISLTKGRMPHYEGWDNPDKLKKSERKKYDELKAKLSDWKGKYTITLSCGKLTTGVSVPDWTAVLYMKGNDSTSASTYMQTIFRVQTPAVIGGAQKTECYVFDFSPIRSLRVFADAVRLNMSAKNGNDRGTKYSRGQQKEEVGKMMKYMPLHAISVPQPGSLKTRMEAYSADSLFRQLDTKLIDRVVRSGYADNSIYDSVKIMDLTEEAELALFNISQKITSDSKSNQEGGDIKWGKDRPKKPTERQKKDAQNANGKKDDEISEEEKEAKRIVDAWNKQKRERMKTLRALSVRIPLLMYGADIENHKALEIDNFTTMVDQPSWDEYMPKNISKDDFDAVRDCYDSVRFKGAAEKIREFAETSDRMSITERVKAIANIFKLFHNPDKETVLTPWRVVNMHMADTIGGYRFFADDYRTPLSEPEFVPQEGVSDKLFIGPNDGDFSDLEKVRVLEINSKTGLYPLYVAYSLFRARKDHYDKAHALDPSKKVKEDHDIWEETLKENLFVVCKTPMAVSITRRTLAGFSGVPVNAICPTWQVSEKILSDAGVIKLPADETADPDKMVETDLVGILRAKEEIEKENERRAKREEAPLDLIFTDQVRQRGWWETVLECELDHNKFTSEMIEFNAVVGNPPYQLTNTGDGNGSEPIYHLFIDSARSISPISTLIHPARFLFNAGKTPKAWNEKILNSTDFKVARYTANSFSIFDNVDIKGGIAITISNSYQNFGKIGLYSPFAEIQSILSKTLKDGFESFSDIVYPRDLYKLTDIIYQENPHFEGRQSKGHRLDLGSSIFDVFPEAFFSDKPEDGDYIGIYGLDNRNRVTKWIKREYIKTPDNIDHYKVMVPKSNGSGAIGEVLSTPVIGVPVIGHTLTFLSIGKFSEISQAEACLKYIRTRFARLLLGTLKVTQDNPKDTWANVPMQDFTANSDIDWSKTVEEIDRQLYKKYGLEQGEIDFIERMIKPME